MYVIFSFKQDGCFHDVQGKVKSMVENRGGTELLDPTPNFDCHVSKTAHIDLSSTSHQYAFESTQVSLLASVDKDEICSLFSFCCTNINYLFFLHTNGTYIYFNIDFSSLDMNH